MENGGGGGRGGVKERERSSGGLSVGERSVRVWGGEVTWVSGKRGRESMIVVVLVCEKEVWKCEEGK